MKISLIITAILLFHVTIPGQTNLGKIDSTKLIVLFLDSTITKLNSTIEEFQKDKSSKVGNVWIKSEFSGSLSNEVDYYQLELALIVPLKMDGHDYWGELSSVLEILSKGDQIIFKRLLDNKGEVKKIKYEEVQLIRFLKGYEQIYNTKIDLNYTKLKLYEDDDFGVACGLVGQLPSKCQAMMDLVNKKQSQELLNWVKNISPLSKAYGVLGLYILTKKGFKLNEEEIKLIDLAKRENIEISTCSGCIVGIKKSLRILLTDKNLNEIYKFLKARKIV